MFESDIYTISVNLAGLPAISLPCALDKNKMPIGVQFIANCFEENKMIAAGQTLEKELAENFVPDFSLV